MHRRPCFENLKISTGIALAFLACLSLSSCQTEEAIEAPAPSAPINYNKPPTLRGFIDKTGKMVIKPQFITASSFREGLAHVVDTRGSFIDTSGNFVIKEPYYVADDFNEGLAAVGVPASGNWADVNRPGDQLRYGFIDKTGKWVIKPQYKTALDFSEGLAAVMPMGSKVWGFINTKGKMVIPPRFAIGMDDIERDLPTFRHGIAFVTTEAGPECIDKTGKELDKQTAKKMQHRENFDEQGFKEKEENNLYGYENKAGKVVIPCKFDKVSAFYDGLALVRTEGKKWGFINTKGDFVIGPSSQYEYEHFCEGLCQVKEANNSQSKYGYIDKSGKLVIPLTFENAEYFHEGFATVGIAVSQEELQKMKLPFAYTIQGSSLSFPMKFTDKDDADSEPSK